MMMGVAADRADITWETYARELGHNLYRARMDRGLSQERVAHLAGLAGYTYQKFEKGESRPNTPMNPRLNTSSRSPRAPVTRVPSTVRVSPQVASHRGQIRRAVRDTGPPGGRRAAAVTH